MVQIYKGRKALSMMFSVLLIIAWTTFVVVGTEWLFTVSIYEALIIISGLFFSFFFPQALLELLYWISKRYSFTGLPNFIDNFEVRRVWVIGMILLITLGVGIYSYKFSRHACVGNYWVSEGVYSSGHTMNIYDDGLASFDGYQCSWSALNEQKIRVLCFVNGEKRSGEFTAKRTLTFGSRDYSF